MFKTLIATTVLISSMSLATSKPQAHEILKSDNQIRKTRVLSHEEMLFPNKDQGITGQSKTHSSKVFLEWNFIINNRTSKSKLK